MTTIDVVDDEADLVPPTDGPLLDETPLDDDSPDSVAPERAGSPRERVAATARQLVAPAAALLVWIYIYLIALLGGWVLLSIAVAGWEPLVITSGSMDPTIRAGDVLLVSDHSDSAIVQSSVVTFERDGDLVSHRVLRVDTDLDVYITKGDANAAADALPVRFDEVEGLGRLVVPVIGLPALWAAEGDTTPLVAWMILTLAAVAYVVRSGIGELRRRRENSQREQPGSIATAGIRRVRVLVALMIGIQYFVDPSRFDLVGRDGQGRDGVLIVSIGVLMCLNLVSARIGRRDPRTSRWMAFLELTVDTLLVVFIATATGTDGIGWVLFALPVMEAAVRFGLTGGLIHWMVLTTVTIGARIGFTEISTGNRVLIGELETVLDQLSVLFIVVIPGAYLAEQLIGDVQRQQRATNAAVGRGRLLEQVVASGHEVNRLGTRHLDALGDGVMALGYDAADVVVQSATGNWRSLTSRGEQVHLPEPGSPGSGLCRADLVHAAVVVDGHEDPDESDRLALERLGISRLVAITISDGDRGRLVLRAAKTPPDATMDSGRIDALHLLAGQALVALQNDQLLTELTTVHDELEHQATHDALTGLPNRPRVLTELRDTVEAGVEACILFLDLDGFKPVNDRFGHDAGDEVLRIVAERLARVTGDDGMVARLGGDEFTLLFTGPEAHARGPEIASAIHTALAEPFVLDMESIFISASIGLADSAPGIEGMELVRRADVSMYHAKRVVREGAAFVRYSSLLDESEARRAELARDLVPALADGGVLLHYQPIVFVGTGERIVGVEALVRWTHPRYGPIGPEELIQLAEEVGNRDELNSFIVHQAARDAASLVAEHPDDGLFVTVNASPAELQSSATVESVVSALAETGLPAESLFIEISERLVDPSEEALVSTMSALIDLGIKLLLDDFGQGQTSLSFLHQLPVTGIKLDRQLVLNSVQSETERIVVESIIELSSRLDLTVIAEGVETQAHLDTITDAGCRIVQGYHFHRPLPLDQVRTLLRDQARRRANTQSLPRALERESDPADRQVW